MRPQRARAGPAVAFVAILGCLSAAVSAQGDQAAAPAATVAPDASPAAAPFDCGRGCSFDVVPACGQDGEWYHNACLAFCSGGVGVAASTDACDGSPMPFLSSHPGPPGAESAGGAAVVPSEVLTRFAAEGFRYLGRIRLARDFGPVPEPADSQPDPEVDADGNWNAKAVRCTSDGDVYVGSMKIPSKPFRLDSYMPPWLSPARALAPLDGNSTLLGLAASLGVIPPPSALRNASRRGGPAASAAPSNGTSFWAPRMKDPKDKTLFESLLAQFMAVFQPAAAPQQQQAPAPGGSPDNSTTDAGAGAADTGATGAVTTPDDASDDGGELTNAPSDAGRRRALLQARLLKELVGGDDRQDCQKGFPYTAVGQIQVVDNTGLYICTGSLIAPDKVLTAGHCVWNIKRGAFYYNLNYAPGRYRDGDRVVNPWGVVPWKSVTVFDSFKANPSTWDIAVVTLTKPLGSLTGYMGMAAGCGRNLQLTVAGYPQDKPAGTCMMDTCNQRALDCESPTNEHQCDTIMGMSGSPLWDTKNRVRLVHVAGIEGEQENRATTLTQFVVNTVTKW